MITGAQKPIDLEITDARSNLMDSLRFDSHDKACGVSIVFGGKVIVGTRAKKEFSKSYDAFVQALGEWFAKDKMVVLSIDTIHANTVA